MAFRYPYVLVTCDICGHELPPHTDEDAAREEAQQRGWAVVDCAVVCHADDLTHMAFAEALTALSARLDREHTP